MREIDGRDIDDLLKATWRLYLLVLGFKYETIYKAHRGEQPTAEQDEDFLCALIEEAHNVWRSIRRRGRERDLGPLPKE